MKKILIATAVLAAAALGATAAFGTGWFEALGLVSEETKLRSRIVNYWDARVSGNFEEMSAFAHPEQDMMHDPGMLVTEAYELTALTMEGESAEALVKVRSRLRHPVMSRRHRELELSNRWVKYDDGQWYLEQMPVGINGIIRHYRQMQDGGVGIPAADPVEASNNTTTDISDEVTQ